MAPTDDQMVPVSATPISEGPDDKPLAKSMMTFMVRGLFTSLQFPYAQFPCPSISGELLFDPFWEAVYRLERCGFKVSFITFCYFYTGYFT